METIQKIAKPCWVKFQQAILKLPEKQRMVFNLRYYDELSYNEIGEILRFFGKYIENKLPLCGWKIKNI